MQIKFDGDRPRQTPPSGELNTRGVAEYSDFGPSVTKWLEGLAFAVFGSLELKGNFSKTN